MPKKPRKVLLVFFIVAVLITIAVELVYQYRYRTVKTVVYSKSESYEYLPAPNQEISNGDINISINHYGMRSENFTAQKTTQEEFRILVFVDSVVYGGRLIDQQRLATSRIPSMLYLSRHNVIVVENISAPSWGPGNRLGYIQKHGFFDADYVFVVVSSHDAFDNPSMKSREPIDRRWTLFIVEKLRVIIKKYCRIIRHMYSEENSSNYAVYEQIMFRGISDLRDFLIAALADRRKVYVISRRTMGEINSKNIGYHPLPMLQEGRKRILDLCRELNVQIIDFGKMTGEELGMRRNPFIDNIHLNELGQEILADAMRRAIVSSYTVSR